MSNYFLNIFETRFKKLYGNGIFNLNDDILSNAEVLDAIEKMPDDGTKEIAKFVTTRFGLNKKIKKIVILGSGSGKLGTRLADYFKNSIIVDIDKSSPVIKRLKNIFNRDKLRMPKLGDARNIPLEKGSVDLIVAYSTLRYINDRRKVIESINKILKSGGYAVIVEARAIDVVEDIESTLKNKRIAFTRNTENNILFSRTSFFYYLVLESSKNKILKNRIEKVENKNNSSFLEAALKCAGKYKGSLYYVSWQKKNG